ncbi:hypothetical protein XELAEV_18041011mg [Xenopus laevis]|uniref:Uncharacterized protein n=1 Tax=Xenopus laevis TaxID=8355 RepID=A0A974H4Q5_XENLA|nr:hypothetical protein XELAEV_18041011mg [Xenopus laevis]
MRCIRGKHTHMYIVYLKGSLCCLFSLWTETQLNAFDFPALLRVGEGALKMKNGTFPGDSLMAFSFQGHFQSIFHLLCCD